MKVVQTFWSAKKNLINNSFGWLSPMHHLMGWALSCLKLKEQYDDLHLYTDQQGYEILIKYLRLPYKTVHVCFDDLPGYNERFWAITKIATYAAQKEPFIHVDGDVFIWKKLDAELENARLIAQNFEIGTDYYKSMLNNIRKDLGFVPDCLLKEWENDAVFSYNAGILGGNDPHFFEHYYAMAVKLIRSYQPLPAGSGSGNFNIVFEQMLFHALAKEQNIQVACYFKQAFADNGYSKEDMGDFMLTPCSQQYLHLIGKYKRDEGTCDLLSRTLLREYPEFFFKVIALFSNQHIHFQNKIRPLVENIYTGTLAVEEAAVDSVDEPAPEQAINNYAFRLNEYTTGWKEIDGKLLYDLEISASMFYGFFCADRETQLKTAFGRHPFIRMVEESFTWPQEVMDALFPALHGDLDEDRYGIACLPDLFFKGYREVAIDEMQYDMLTILQERLTLHDLMERLKPLFYEEVLQENYDLIYTLVMIKLKHLLHHRCIFIKNN